MNLDTLYQYGIRLIFAVAVLGLGIAGIELVANLLEYTFLRGLYSAGRLVELSAGLLVFVIAMLLRQIRDAVSNGAS